MDYYSVDQLAVKLANRLHKMRPSELKSFCVDLVDKAYNPEDARNADFSLKSWLNFQLSRTSGVNVVSGEMEENEHPQAVSRMLFVTLPKEA